MKCKKENNNSNREVPRVVDITEISAVVAAAGVLVGVAYYILDMRNQTRMRKTELLTRLYSTMVNKDWLEAWDIIDRLESDDLIKMRQKKGWLR